MFLKFCQITSRDEKRTGVLHNEERLHKYYIWTEVAEKKTVLKEVLCHDFG